MNYSLLWHVTRPKGIGTGSDSEPLSVQRIGLVKDPSKMPFWCATWFIKVISECDSNKYAETIMIDQSCSPRYQTSLK